MTTASTMYMETVSLNDDAPSSAVVDVASLEAQCALPKDATPEQDEAETTEQTQKEVVVDVQSLNGKHTLPPLRVMTQKLPVEERDYVDTSLFSPEVSRHAMDVAHRRAKTIASEVKQLMELEPELPPPKTKMSPAEAVGIIGGAFVSSLQRAKKFVKPGTKEYDLLAGTSPVATLSKLDDPDTDGDGLQLSPEATPSKSRNFRPKLRSALKRISAYSTLDTEKTSTKHKKKAIQWHEDVLDHDEEFYEDDNEQETLSLMKDGDVAGNGSPRPQILNYSSKNDGQLTPRSKKKRKKLVRSMMRRLTPREKEELYRQRPDLMIVPNWAQKYREELAGEDSTRWNAWLLGLISMLAVLLLVFVVLIVRQRAAAIKK
ncbi:hypothetical protein PHMEG_00010357 [Phytophthora megakarya]|uniref:Uncharacterized protein n=1 Tax=Phytophthora megakarya TaxID=4795 RepID=A0A225WEG4_9STRA|nr:hypothetical protein PHMEG_00010357 [Phytophthora megakarya]